MRQTCLARLLRKLRLSVVCRYVAMTTAVSAAPVVTSCACSPNPGPPAPRLTLLCCPSPPLGPAPVKPHSSCENL
jgi:hypothetical protein